MRRLLERLVKRLPKRRLERLLKLEPGLDGSELRGDSKVWQAEQDSQKQP